MRTGKMTAEKLRDAFGYMYPDELPFFKKLIQSLPANPIIINIGAGAGTSGLAALECRDDSIVRTIDIRDESDWRGCLEGERIVVGQAGLSHLAGDRWHQHHGDSKAIGAKWLTKVDLVYVDGDHTYAGCAGDIKAWMPHLRCGGLLIVHDYDKKSLPFSPTGPHPKNLPEIDQAVEELLIGKYKEHSRCDSMIVFTNEKIETEKPKRQPSKPSASKPRRAMGRQKAT